MEKFNKLFTSAVFTAVAAFGLANPSLANDAPLVAITVPASSCTPASEAESNRVQLSNGAWAFNGAHTGTVSFYCPLPLNRFDVNNPVQVNDMSKYRIYYRDPDGGTLGNPYGVPVGLSALVTARLVYRKHDGLYSGGTTWASHWTPFNQTGDTTAIKTNNHTLEQNALYSFLVTLTRHDSKLSPAFGGIDFPIYADSN